jgi:hypothetical protein
MEAQPIQDVVAAAVRDSDIYVAYEELDAARDALKKALKAYPGDVLLEARLAHLEGAASAPAAHENGIQPVDDDDCIGFELEQLGSEDASNIVPFKRAV